MGAVMASIVNLALSSLEIGAGLTLSGSTLSAAAGSSTRTTRLVSVDATLASTDYYIGYTGVGGHTITLPDPALLTNGEFIVKNRGLGSLTISAAAGGGLFTTIGVASMTLLPGESIHIISDGQYWDVVAMASGIVVP